MDTFRQLLSHDSIVPAPARPAAKGGRPRALDPSARSIISLLTALGYTQKTVARLVGCAPCTVRREALRNPEFRAKLAEARHDAEVSIFHDIVQAAATRPSAAQWLKRQINAGLERMSRPRDSARNSKPGAPSPSAGFPSAQNWPDFCALADLDFAGKSGVSTGPQRAKPRKKFSASGDSLAAGRRRNAAKKRRARESDNHAHRTKKPAKISPFSSSTYPQRSTRSGRTA